MNIKSKRCWKKVNIKLYNFNANNQPSNNKNKWWWVSYCKANKNVNTQKHEQHKRNTVKQTNLNLT